MTGVTSAMFDELREGIFGVEIDVAAQQLPIVGVTVERGRVAMEGRGIHRQTAGAGRPEVYVDANITVEDRGTIKKFPRSKKSFGGIFFRAGGFGSSGG